MEVFDSNLDTKRRQEEIVYYHGLTTEMAAMMCQRFHTCGNDVSTFSYILEHNLLNNQKNRIRYSKFDNFFVARGNPNST